MSIVKFKSVIKSMLLASVFCLTIGNSWAMENVLQAIQIEGVKDSYDIILKSDDNAEVKKTIQAPNKMLLDIKGIRASKSLNTIYNNTSTVDSVTVEQIGADSLKIHIQADNVSNAQVKFDSLKTPVLAKTTPAKSEVLLNPPIESFKPIYEEIAEDETSFDTTILSSIATKAKGLLKDEKISWTIVFGLFAIIVLNGVKKLQPAPAPVKIGLSSNLKDREIDMYRNINSKMIDTPRPQVNAAAGLKAYQSSTRSPYMSTGLPTRAPMQTPARTETTQPKANTVKTMIKPETPTPQRKAGNIDNMRFLESMTQIYEKSGRHDLAQGLKTNIQKARSV